MQSFKEMLYCDALRGWDSTGIATINNWSSKVDVYKDSCVPGVLFNRMPNLWDVGNRAMIGHNRAATRGKTTKENAHPFTVDNITLVHNGTLWGDFKHLGDTEVDSHAICTAFSKKEPKKIIPKLEGAFALVWYNDKTGNIYFTRNEQRPLHIVETTNTYIIISEPKLAEWICTRNNETIVSTTECVPYKVYTINLEKDATISSEQLTKKKPTPTVQMHVVPAKQTTHSFDTSKATYAQQKEAFINYIKQIGIELKKNTIATIYEYHKFGYKKNNKYEGCYYAYLEEDSTVELEILTETHDKDLIWSTGICNVNDIRYQYENNTFVLECTDYIKIEDHHDDSDVAYAELQEEEPQVFKNGIEYTEEIQKTVRDTCCSICGNPFQYHKDALLYPIGSAKHTYRYTYICDSCSDSPMLEYIGEARH